MQEFSFDKLAKLALEDPDKFEVYRAKLLKQFIELRGQDEQRKLNGLQFRIDMERRKARTPLAACLRLNCIMLDFVKSDHIPGIRMCILHPKKMLKESTDKGLADIIKFPV